MLAVLFQLRELTRQIKLQHLADYITRHQSLLQGLPDDINTPGLALGERPDYDRTMQRMRAYFDLFFGKWYLAHQHEIDPDIWRIWRGGITSTLSKPAFQHAWAIIKSDAKFEADFESFVDQCINYPSSRLAA